MMKVGIDVLVFKDKGGGYIYEQYKCNYQVIQVVGVLYWLIGDMVYVDYVCDLLLGYVKFYFGLGVYLQGCGQIFGWLFWQIFNDLVWLVSVVQGYDVICDIFSVVDCVIIDNKVFWLMVDFLSGMLENFDKIYNYVIWVVVVVGMIGYVLCDFIYVDKVLKGSRCDGSVGFFKQVDQLFLLDGYYEEGFYYQCYVLVLFILFVNVIECNVLEQGIFKCCDGVLLKVVDVLVQISYGGYFFLINDVILDKGLDIEELVVGIDIVYVQIVDVCLFLVVKVQKCVLFLFEGLQVVQVLVQDKVMLFDFVFILLCDGLEGIEGVLVILCMGGVDGQVLVMKNIKQGMGYGYFDKFNWLFYDNGQCVVIDYGVVCFFNIEVKFGGIYLLENISWVCQIIVYNMLVVNEQSYFGGDWKKGQVLVLMLLLFVIGYDMQIVLVCMVGVYDGVVFICI